MDWRQLDRFLAGESSPAEDASVRRWIDESPDRGRFVDSLRHGTPTDAPAAGWNVDAAWERVAARIASEPVVDTATSMKPGVSGVDVPRLTVERGGRDSRRRGFLDRLPRTVIRVAAAVAVVAGSTLLVRDGLRRQAPDGTQTASREASTPRGKRADVRLADGTRVVLGAGSRLRYPASFGDRREVTLAGEAFFQVAHDPAHPFLVHAGDAVTQVLGTEFSVRALPDMPDVDVIVATGSVALRRAGSAAGGAVLTRGQLGRLARTGDVTVTAVADVARRLGWTEGRLALDDIALRDAVAELERWYDADIEIADATLAARRLTAILGDQSLPRALDAIALALDARWERTGDIVVIRPK